MTGIYKITNKINNKIYIGQSIDIERRWKSELAGNCNDYLKRSIKKYGKDNFLFEVIETCQEALLNEREMYYIELMESWKPQKGYNLTLGGNQTSIKFVKKVICIETGEIFKSANEAAKIIGCSQGNLSTVCRGEKQTVFGLHYSYYEEGKEYSIRKYISPCSKSVICIETGVVYNSIREAEKETNLKNSLIVRACKNPQRTVGGFHWSYYEEGKVYDRNFLKKKSAAKKVICEETGIIYDSMVEASQSTGIHFKNISAACRRKNGVSGGFHWSYYEEGGEDES